eukprot:TRINITY_DN10488_c0_g2_i1.p1 TRINITY_DN10488_c0_g2~~TRINITY_DN10488_c0_g2_i1.p1  ORF type:complete len:708 (+),score=268.28 TRINITY_DN10488_c0_g2_i1:43-2124(+)
MGLKGEATRPLAGRRRSGAEGVVTLRLKRGGQRVELICRRAELDALGIAADEQPQELLSRVGVDRVYRAVAEEVFYSNWTRKQRVLADEIEGLLGEGPFAAQAAVVMCSGERLETEEDRLRRRRREGELVEEIAGLCADVATHQFTGLKLTVDEVLEGLRDCSFRPDTSLPAAAQVAEAVRRIRQDGVPVKRESLSVRVTTNADGVDSLTRLKDTHPDDVVFKTQSWAQSDAPRNVGAQLLDADLSAMTYDELLTVGEGSLQCITDEERMNGFSDADTSRRTLQAVRVRACGDVKTVVELVIAKSAAEQLIRCMVRRGELQELPGGDDGDLALHSRSHCRGLARLTPAPGAPLKPVSAPSAEPTAAKRAEARARRSKGGGQKGVSEKDDLDGLSLKQLQERCHAAGLPSKGRREDVLDGLRLHRRTAKPLRRGGRESDSSSDDAGDGRGGAASQKDALLRTLAAFAKEGGAKALTLPLDRQPVQRRELHEMADSLGLGSQSFGGDDTMFIAVHAQPLPTLPPADLPAGLPPRPYARCVLDPDGWAAACRMAASAPVDAAKGLAHSGPPACLPLCDGCIGDALPPTLRRGSASRYGGADAVGPVAKKAKAVRQLCHGDRITLRTVGIGVGSDGRVALGVVGCASMLRSPAVFVGGGQDEDPDVGWNAGVEQLRWTRMDSDYMADVCGTVVDADR